MDKKQIANVFRSMARDLRIKVRELESLASEMERRADSLEAEHLSEDFQLRTGNGQDG